MLSDHLMSLRGLCIVSFLSACSSNGATTDGPGSGGAGAVAGQGSGGAGAPPNSGGTLVTSGGAPGTGGSGNAGGAPRRPPNPRPDIGPPDGTKCIGNVGAELTCAVGQQCCPAGITDTASE